jgi:hypothetical protein
LELEAKKKQFICFPGTGSSRVRKAAAISLNKQIQRFRRQQTGEKWAELMERERERERERKRRMKRVEETSREETNETKLFTRLNEVRTFQWFSETTSNYFRSDEASANKKQNDGVTNKKVTDHFTIIRAALIWLTIKRESFDKV